MRVPNQPRVSVAIAAHPNRAAMAHALAARLDREARIVWDTRRDEWGTHEAAWIAHEPTATHHLVLQDDAVPCQDLIAGTERLLARVPQDAPVSLYLGDHHGYRGSDPRHHAVTRAVSLADHHDASWVTIPGTWWGVALILPVGLIGAMLEYCIGRTEVYDLRLTRWCQHANLTCFYPWPSLVDHADTDSIVIPGRSRGRVARRHLGPDTSALTVDPSTTKVTVTPAAGSWPPKAWTVTPYRPEFPGGS